MGDVILYKEDVDRLNFLLKNLVNDSNILSALLITKDTRVLAFQGVLTVADPGALAALLIGSFASTQAIAGLIGETEFDTMSHRGKTRNVMISLIDDDTVLASIFDKNSTFDRIHACVAKYQDKLRKVLRTIGQNTTNGLFDTGSSPGSEEGNEFEMPTALFNRTMEPQQTDAMENSTLQGQTVQKPMREATTERSHSFSAEKELKQTAAYADHDAIKDIKPPPDTKMLSSEETHSQPEESDNAKPPVHSEKKKNEDFVPPESQTPSQTNDFEELSIGANEKASRTSADSPNKKEQYNSSAESFSMSMNYLKNKTREGALYYHHDKAFFKKFFKSSHKKKV
jgi:predicted regulator of Ras-like GTPase activity (Roadblock/LC7/MglB family)